MCVFIARAQIWKRLVLQRPELSDIDAVDSLFVRNLQKLRAPDCHPSVSPLLRICEAPAVPV